MLLIILFDSTLRFPPTFNQALEKENQYKQIPRVDQMAVHFQLDGNLIHVGSEEARIQLGLLDSASVAETKTDVIEEEQEVLKILTNLHISTIGTLTDTNSTSALC